MDNETKRMLFDATVWTISLLATLILLAQVAWADSNASPATQPKWKAECGSCHTTADQGDFRERNIRVPH